MEPLPAIDVEYCCFGGPDEYDDQGFAGFPARSGWLVSEHPEGGNLVAKTTGRPPSTEETSGFLQSWLFFGVLATVFGKIGLRMRPRDFFRESGSLRLVTLVLLDRYLEDWAEAESNRDDSSRREIHQAVAACISHAQKIILSNIRTRLDGSVRASIEALCTILSKASSVIQQAPSRSTISVVGELRKLCTFRLQILDSPFVEQEACSFAGDYNSMLKLGWCPSDISRLVSQAGDSLWFGRFASTLSRRVGESAHAACNRYECALRKFDDKTYQTRHVPRCHGCTPVPIETGKIGLLLERGVVPRVRIRRIHHWGRSDHREGATLEVEEDGPFVAISHVWSDGLGNPRANSLPTCQLLRLLDLAAGVDADQDGKDGVGLWIDTLCVPLEKNKRILALRQMGKAYTDAQHVLVIDNELQSFSLDCSDEEKLARVLLSGWMQRLWTLEEGVLGRDRLHFQFHEKAFTFPAHWAERHMLHNHNESYNNSPLVLMDALTIFNNAIPERPSLDTSLTRYNLGVRTNTRIKGGDYYTTPNPMVMTRSLQLRATTKYEDEPLCVGSLFHLSTRAIAACKTRKERMYKFYELLAHFKLPVSSSILFTNEPKLDCDVFRWAPDSLMRLEVLHPLQAQWLYAEDIFTTSGLLAQLDGIAFSVPANRCANGFRFLQLRDADSDETSFWEAYEPDPAVGVDPGVDNGRGLFKLRGTQAVVTTTALDIAELAVILCPEDQFAVEERYFAAGLLVQKTSPQGSQKNQRCLSVRYIKPLWRVSEDGISDTEGVVYSSNVAHIVEQLWCVS